MVPKRFGFLLSPTATVEELYLAQKLARGFGVADIDRLRQADFSDQDAAPIFWLGQELADLEKVGAALLIGSNIVDGNNWLAGHRWRKAALAGGRILLINPRDGLSFSSRRQSDRRSAGMVAALVGVALAVAGIERPGTADGTRCSGWRRVRRGNRAPLPSIWSIRRPPPCYWHLAVAHPAFAAQLRALASWLLAVVRTWVSARSRQPAGGGWPARCRIACQGASAPTVGLGYAVNVGGAPPKLCAAGSGSRNWIGIALRR